MDSSPGHLFQTSFSQPALTETTPDSKSSSENAGFTDRVDSSSFIAIHLASMPILLSSGQFSKLTSGAPSMPFCLPSDSSPCRKCVSSSSPSSPIRLCQSRSRELATALWNGGRLCSSAILRKSKNVPAGPRSDRAMCPMMRGFRSRKACFRCLEAHFCH